MANPLIDPVLPKELASRGQHIEFKGKVGELGRLAEIVEADLAALSEERRPHGWQAAPFETRLEFGWAEGPQRIPTINGRIVAQIPAVCQRCLEAFELTLDASIRMLLVWPNAEPGEMPDLAEFEIWELDERTLQPLDIVEESLVMAIPLAPRHESEESCVALENEVTESGAEMAHPFADLRSQIDESNK